jgi:DNA-binding PadR family transcriptional regulator
MIMEHVVLGLLMIQSLTIYGLNRAFKQGISLFYSASYGSLQTAVKNLLGKGWIVFEERVDQGRNKKVYSITEHGRQAFYEWMLAEIPANKLEVTALSKVFFLGLMESMEQKRQIVREILNKVDLVQKELSEMRQEISGYEIPDPYREIFKYQMKTLDYGLHAHDFARQWFLALLNEMES